MQLHTVRSYGKNIFEGESDVFGRATKRAFGREKQLPL